MVLTAHMFPLTGEVSPRVEVVAQTGSTNADLVRHVSADPGAWPHLSVLLTDDQRSGRGRLDRVWKAPAGTALAISVVVRTDAVPAAARGWLPLLAGAAMTRAVAAQVAAASVSARLKWPNDVLLSGGSAGEGARKLCGILAEVVPADPDAVVIGAGVNTAMPADALPVDTAVSFQAVGLTADADRLVADYLADLDAQLRALAAAGGDAEAAGIRAAVAGLCATIGEPVKVSLPGGGTLVGIARAIDADGRLVVEDASGAATPVGAGDVVHVR
ncbi:biotin--[acetyl-CoA-carboxylase] ligase [Microbacterium thalassium]|uniref:biotin--[biotin carboxyl-carrier protein] ligase n=1 Tax=Microbacterium thalassium TaxID=362649 RepID=A0A7X0FQC7_9MICO|nr:biotin--[acetyl-CoA-carboxylase] ligase [Microbacterium thalassium]MBB6391285.1 BirA family biotin operon repressor/biotin-[acetyl-CoA-carboxylase] ligase [Microbacterium thalassium]GLK23603.1 biotin--[acetyl-CoA-carboxylase] ligase [Microbacterium thalassium]